MRGDLAAALLHDPPLLFLDEPTIGLDVEVRDTLLELVQRLNRDQGVSVVLTTHDLLNLEKVSHRILVIERGRLIFDDTLGALKNLFGPLRRVVVQFRDPIEERTLLAPGIPVRIAGDSATFEIDLNKMPIRDLLTIIDRSGHVIDVSISEPSIETIVKKLTGPVDRPQTQPDDG
jgi:ABC-2 type transport system ATP-binding protein